MPCKSNKISKNLSIFYRKFLLIEFKIGTFSGGGCLSNVFVLMVARWGIAKGHYDCWARVIMTLDKGYSILLGKGHSGYQLYPTVGVDYTPLVGMGRNPRVGIDGIPRVGYDKGSLVGYFCLSDTLW